MPREKKKGGEKLVKRRPGRYNGGGGDAIKKLEGGEIGTDV